MSSYNEMGIPMPEGFEMDITPWQVKTHLENHGDMPIEEIKQLFPTFDSADDMYNSHEEGMEINDGMVCLTEYWFDTDPTLHS